MQHSDRFFKIYIHTKIAKTHSISHKPIIGSVGQSKLWVLNSQDGYLFSSYFIENSDNSRKGDLLSIIETIALVR